MDNRIRDIAPVPPQPIVRAILPSGEEIQQFIALWSPPLSSSVLNIYEVSLIESALLRWPCVTVGHGKAESARNAAELLTMLTKLEKIAAAHQRIATGGDALGREIDKELLAALVESNQLRQRLTP